jgi:hypothetical protein
MCLGIFPVAVSWGHRAPSGEALVGAGFTAVLYLGLGITGLLVLMVPRLGLQVGIPAAVVQGIVATMCAFWILVYAGGLVESGFSPPMGLGTMLLHVATFGATVALCVLGIVGIIQVVYRAR